MDVIGVIIAGIIIGLLGKFVAPGNRDDIPLWLTVLCGIGGVLIGYYIAAALGVEATRGIDWIRWIISIVVAAVLVMIAASVILPCRTCSTTVWRLCSRRPSRSPSATCSPTACSSLATASWRVTRKVPPDRSANSPKKARIWSMP